jgi:hypothetical protein
MQSSLVVVTLPAAVVLSTIVQAIAAAPTTAAAFQNFLIGSSKEQVSGRVALPIRNSNWGAAGFASKL